MSPITDTPYGHVPLYIAGRFIAGEGRSQQDIVDPATFAVVGTYTVAAVGDLDEALASAERALRDWRQRSPLERSDILRKAAALLRERAPEIARRITLDQGKTLAEAITEVMSSADHMDWHAEEGRRIYGRIVPSRNPAVRQLVVREPVGVCVALTPWNLPLMQAARKVAAALATGCTVIVKGPTESPSGVEALARALHDAGLPAGVLAMVWGPPGEVAEQLITSPLTRKLSFTGSVPVGKQLAALAGAHMKRMTMELGGHAPVLVFDDADVEAAADQMAAFKVRNAGQLCVSPTRFYVQRRVYDRFAARLLDRMKGVTLGHGLQPQVQMGPLANARRTTAMEELVADACDRGGRLLLGGERSGGAGHFYRPSVLAEVPDNARVATEEPFGPLAVLRRFDDLAEVFPLANRLPFGLAAYVYTQSQRTATEAAQALEVGIVAINHLAIALPETPFGGIKDSGFGSEGGTEGLDGYLVTKFITQT
jgi:succinate-semialdehyde dehydrogenase/glutarate-semialdehyde dehydrogenase